MSSNRSLRTLFEADRLFRHASEAQLKGHFHVALRGFRAALSAYQRTSQKLAQIDTLLKIGDLSRQTESFTDARHAYTSAYNAAQLQRATPDINSKKLDALLGEALCLRGEGQYKNALTKLRRCLLRYKKIHDLEAQAYVLWALGTTARFAGRFQEAEQSLTASLPLYKRLRDQSGTAYALCGLGGTLRMRGEARMSLQCYRRANQTFTKLGDRFGMAYSFCGQSNALRMQNQIHKALPLMKRAEKLYRSLKLKGPLGFVLWSQAQAYGALQKWSESQRTLLEAAELFRSAKDKRGLLYCEIGRAELAHRQNKLISKSIFKNAEKTARALHLPFERAHSLRFSNPALAQQLYRRCGVSSSYSTYKTLP